MNTEIKIQILLVVMMSGVLVVALMLISNALGNIHNVVTRFEEIIEKENRLEVLKKSSKINRVSKKKKIEQVKSLRAKSLLNVHIPKNKKNDKDA